jgi:exonuclease SbcD
LIGLISDIHIKDSRIAEIEAAFKRCIGLLKFDTLFILGDIFDSRKSLTFESLQCFHRLLGYAKDKKVIIIPGNHDKISYQSKESYLDIFRHYPNVTLYDDLATISIEGWSIYLLPFFDEKTVLIERLDLIKDVPEKSILLTHIAIDGVRNNDHSPVSGILSRNIFKEFNKVLVGHYHNRQEFDNVLYMGSFIPKDFSEDELKGLTVFYENGTIEQFPLSDKKYLTIDIDLEKEDGKEKLQQYKDSTDNIRFNFIGDKGQLNSIEKSEFTSCGISVSSKEKTDGTEDQNKVIDFSGFDKSKIVEQWDGFCQEKQGRIKYQKQGKDLLLKL